MAIAKINDLDMYYEDHGNGFPLVLVPGFSADHSLWSTVTESLSDRYRVITFDNRGAGQSTVTNPPYSINQLANDVEQLCKYLNISSANFIGNSMGGMIVQYLLKSTDLLVNKAVICNSSPCFEVAYKYYLQAHLELLRSNAQPKALTMSSIAWCFSNHFLSKDDNFKKCIDLWTENTAPFTLQGFTGQMAALNSFDSRDWLGKVKKECLIISGENDIVLPKSASEKIAELIPQSSYREIKQAGHLPHVEFPEMFTDIVVDFFND